ncbi:hypothetical protein M758_1G286400 [Ceratodon purpureus]|nr:hypothetical protein M758_1G286400 [Ceratodon purpureus]
MATHVPGADNQSSTDQGQQISGPESETSVLRHADLNLNIPTPIPNYNPYMLMQQVGAQSYPTYPIPDSQQSQYDQQGYVPSGIHGGGLYTTPQELHHSFQGYHPPVQEQMQGFPELQQQNYMQQPEGYIQSSQTAFETRQQGQMQRILPRRLPHMRQRIRRRNRTNRPHISHINSVAADIVYNREHSTAASITGSVTSGPVQTPVEFEGSQERLARLTSAVTAIEESSVIGENFECNICFQKANEAVVTCCGHLFCWPCLYRWLHVHSYHKECPVCKGSIAEYSITPIYGRENALASARMQGALGSERIPPRPAARRIESARQVREREEREREREIREAEARESTNQVTEIEQVATEIDEEGEPRAPGAEAPTSEITLQSGEGNLEEGAETATRLQDRVHEVNELGRETGELIEHSHSSYLQRRLAFRREQLRQALANSRYSAAANQIPETRGGDRQQMLAASALLSQEWENIINGNGLVVDPTQAATWLASMHARLASMEENAEPNSNDAQQRRQMIASAVSQLSQQPQDDSIGRLAVHPSHVSDWITTMRTRLNNIEQIMQNLERPIGGSHLPQSTITSDAGNPYSLEVDDADDTNPGTFLAELNATATPQETASGSEQNPNHDAGQNASEVNERRSERIVPEAQTVRRSRRRREHGEEPSRVVTQEEGTEAPHEDQLPLTRKRRRRLD